ncbi:MAG: hypothetical protein JXC85_02525, partial [Candidatus Aenigmarchaeota archaeon]|nr:hypothetical protein [Candidatus Aenigmarchaeota archaeon]
MIEDGEPDVSDEAAAEGAHEEAEAGEPVGPVEARVSGGGAEEKASPVVKSEADILKLIKQENSWEQILYDVVAIQDMDPWNLDLL